MKKYSKPTTNIVFVEMHPFMDSLSGDPDKTITDGSQFLGKDNASDSDLWED